MAMSSVLAEPVLDEFTTHPFVTRLKRYIGLSDADIKKVILSGKGKMKPVAGVTEKQADDIAAFVKTLKE